MNADQFFLNNFASQLVIPVKVGLTNRSSFPPRRRLRLGANQANF